MPKDYQLRTNPLSRNRLLKTCKEVIDAGKEDRTLALDCYRYFKNRADDGDDAAKAQMTVALKLAQSSKVNTIKVMELAAKIEEIFSASKKGKNAFDRDISLFESVDNE